MFPSRTGRELRGWVERHDGTACHEWRVRPTPARGAPVSLAGRTGQVLTFGWRWGNFIEQCRALF